MSALSKNELGALQSNNRTKVVLWIIGSCAFCYSLHLVVSAYVKLHDDPPWLKLLMFLSGLLIYLAGPVWMYRLTIQWQKRFIVDFSDRLGRIEELVDPERKTSGLNRDGTDPIPGNQP